MPDTTMDPEYELGWGPMNYLLFYERYCDMVDCEYTWQQMWEAAAMVGQIAFANTEEQEAEKHQRLEQNRLDTIARVIVASGGAALAPGAWSAMLTRSYEDASKWVVDWEAAQVQSLSERGECTRIAFDKITSTADRNPAFFSPTPGKKGDGSAVSHLLEVLPDFSALHFDKRGDVLESTSPRRHPTSIKLLPLLLRTKLKAMCGVALREYQTAVQQGKLMNWASNKESVQKLIYKVFPVVNLSMRTHA